MPPREALPKAWKADNRGTVPAASAESPGITETVKIRIAIATDKILRFISNTPIIQNLTIDYTITNNIINYFPSKCKVLDLVLIDNISWFFL